MERGGGHMVFIGIAIFILGLDLFIKHQIEQGKGTSEQGIKLQKKVFRDKIIIDNCHNYGAVLNIGEKNPKMIKRISLIIAGGILVAFARALVKKESAWYCFGMALLVGGSASNVYDRIKRGYVVDYFHFRVKWKKLRQMVFNLADMFIIAGAIIAMVEKIKE